MKQVRRSGWDGVKPKVRLPAVVVSLQAVLPLPFQTVPTIVLMVSAYTLSPHVNHGETLTDTTDKQQ